MKGSSGLKGSANLTTAGLLLVLFCASTPAFADHSKTVTVVGWGGPETSMQCPSIFDCHVALLQHEIDLTMTAPDDVDVDQVVSIKDACSASAAVAGAATNVDGAIAAFQACIQTTQLFSALATQGVSFSVGHHTHW